MCAECLEVARRVHQGAPRAQTIPVQTEENGEGTNDTEQGEEEADEDAEEGETAQPVEASDDAEVEEEVEGIQPMRMEICGQDCESCEFERPNHSPYASPYQRVRHRCILQPGHAETDAHLCMNCANRWEWAAARRRRMAIATTIREYNGARGLFARALSLRPQMESDSG